MSNQKNNGFAGEILTPEIARKQIIEIGKTNRIPPSVGIFDSPTRCFVVNTEWWAHIAGMVHWLADVTAWQDAENEEYFAIREILKFMQGIECMDFQLRQNPADNCILQQTLDGGESWSDVFDFSLCATIQDKSTSVNIQNSITYVQPTFQEIYNNYTTNYTGTPESVYPDLAAPSGDDSALKAAYCNAIWELVKVSCDAAISYYTETINVQQGELQIGLGIAAFLLAAISLAAAVPTAGASLAGLAPAAGLWAAGVGLGAVLATVLVDYWQQHTIDQFQDTEAREEVVCYLVDEVAAGDNSLAAMQSALGSHSLSGNAAVIADSLSIMLANDGLYAAFLEKWNNNKQYADAGIDLYCPCATEYRVWVWDFANGLGDFVAHDGFIEGGRVRGADLGGLCEIDIRMPSDPTWRYVTGELTYTRVGGISHGSNDQHRITLRPTPNSNSGSTQLVGAGFQPNGDLVRCETILPVYVDGINEVSVFLLVSDPSDSSDIYLDKIRLMFHADYAKGGYITDDSDICS